MLFVPTYANDFADQVASYGTTRPAATAGMGATITPGTASEGAWAAVASALPSDCYFLLVNINTGFTASTPRNYVLDIGVDPAGGTTYLPVITDLLCGSAIQPSETGFIFLFPLFIPAGATIGARAQGTNASTVRVYTITYHKQRDRVRVGSFVETIGVTPGNILGTSITPGTTNEGAWTSIGTTSTNLWAWQVSLQTDASDTSWNTAVILVDIAVGDGTNFDIISNNVFFRNNSQEYAAMQPHGVGYERFVPAGSTIYARAQSSTTLDAYTIAVYGVGG